MVDYNNFAKIFSNSRKNMKWEEIDYFLENINKDKALKILDIWCWSARLLEHFSNNLDINYIKYLGLDLSVEMIKYAKQNFPDKEFLNLDMLDLDKVDNKFNNIFLIASFHHLNNLEDREQVLIKAYDLLEKWWRIFMTNWALNSEINNAKYSNYIIKNSENTFWSLDYNILFWENDRYYHCFDLSELKYLSEQTKFNIIENRLFNNGRNFITILEK